jgi:hypothetical protein
MSVTDEAGFSNTKPRGAVDLVSVACLHRTRECAPRVSLENAIVPDRASDAVILPSHSIGQVCGFSEGPAPPAEVTKEHPSSE